MSYYFFDCPKCHEEICAEVDDEIVMWGEECENPNCKYKFSQKQILDIYDKAMQDNLENLIDRADMIYGDR